MCWLLQWAGVKQRRPWWDRWLLVAASLLFIIATISLMLLVIDRGWVLWRGAVAGIGYIGLMLFMRIASRRIEERQLEQNIERFRSTLAWSELLHDKVREESSLYRISSESRANRFQGAKVELRSTDSRGRLSPHFSLVSGRRVRWGRGLPVSRASRTWLRGGRRRDLCGESRGSPWEARRRSRRDLLLTSCR
jgi:hypothetical protein